MDAGVGWGVCVCGRVCIYMGLSLPRPGAAVSKRVDVYVDVYICVYVNVCVCYVCVYVDVCVCGRVCMLCVCV